MESRNRASSLIGSGLYEAPTAYKDINQVMSTHQELAEVLGCFMPKIVTMCGDERFKIGRLKVIYNAIFIRCFIKPELITIEPHFSSYNFFSFNFKMLLLTCGLSWQAMHRIKMHIESGLLFGTDSKLTFDQGTTNND